MAKPKFTPPEVCPVCGEDVPSKALACPECGADEKSGWNEEAGSYTVDSSEDEFDYDKFVAEEFGGKGAKKTGVQRFWWVVAVLVLVGLFVVRFFA